MLQHPGKKWVEVTEVRQQPQQQIRGTTTQTIRAPTDDDQPNFVTQVATSSTTKTAATGPSGLPKKAPVDRLKVATEQPKPEPKPEPTPDLTQRIDLNDPRSGVHGTIEEDPTKAEDARSQTGSQRTSSLESSVAEEPSYGLWRTRANVGNWTGAIRPHYPRIRRPFGTNPRQLFFGGRYTGMSQTGFDASIVESKATPPLIPSSRKMVQDGCPTITDYIPALRSGGSDHVFLGTNRRS